MLVYVHYRRYWGVGIWKLPSLKQIDNINEMMKPLMRFVSVESKLLRSSRRFFITPHFQGCQLKYWDAAQSTVAFSSYECVTQTHSLSTKGCQNCKAHRIPLQFGISLFPSTAAFPITAHLSWRATAVFLLIESSIVCTLLFWAVREVVLLLHKGSIL